MLYLFSGSDWQKLNQKASDLIAGLQHKQPEADTIELEADNKNLFNELMSAAGDQGLFFSKNLVRIPRLFPSTEAEDVMKGLVKILVESPSVFIWSEPDLNKTWLNRLEKAGAKIEIFNNSIDSAKAFNVFAISDALLARDRKNLWKLLHQAKQEGLEAEAVFGSIWWQVKSLILAKKYPSADRAGLKPFVYQKCQRSNLSSPEAQALLFKLIKAQEASKSSIKTNLWLELQAVSLEL